MGEAYQASTSMGALVQKKTKGRQGPGGIPGAHIGGTVIQT